MMENTLQIRDPENLKYIFDLKGSLVNRKVKGKIKSSTTLKDVNFMILSEATPGFIELGEKTRKRILDLIKKDVDFLAGHQLMDYSLLLAIETYDENETFDLYDADTLMKSYRARVSSQENSIQSKHDSPLIDVNDVEEEGKMA